MTIAIVHSTTYRSISSIVTDGIPSTKEGDTKEKFVWVRLFVEWKEHRNLTFHENTRLEVFAYGEFESDDHSVRGLIEAIILRFSTSGWTNRELILNEKPFTLVFGYEEHESECFSDIFQNFPRLQDHEIFDLRVVSNSKVGFNWSTIIVHTERTRNVPIVKYKFQIGRVRTRTTSFQ